MSGNAETGPTLSSDFAERVLARADVFIARRTRIRRVIGGVTGLSFAVVAAISWAAISGAWQISAPAAKFAAAKTTPVEVSSGESDALSDFFPDAASVAQFATEYSDATEGTDTALLSDGDPTS